MMEISWYLLKDHILQHYSMHILKYYGIKSANQPTNQSINHINLKNIKPFWQVSEI